MEKIFYAETGAFGPTERVMRKIFSEYCGMREIEIVKSETGKPFLARTPFFFSVTHTREVCFIAVSDGNVGIDAELLSREIDYVPILSKFSATEKAEIRSREDFLRHWTAKESVVKWLGGSLASDLKKIDYLEGMIFYAGLELPVRLSHFEREGHIVALCRANDGPPPPFIRL